ncbi:hypothetical protein [Paeniglutamicibacter cryotolerans]|uniref:Uncharacterized protein n=1 Tax=Paeniglutamicibacter cryotolerans TaxID=670079 RepID=A0A839QP14_9MICC|nr:hypothetical protein [Paeniglutamicibacter cryotolerans]MBB2997500.1 hypothetical protein [Paeniglutamicibacter cryotolerans]
MTTRASEIYDQLKTLRFQLEQLGNEGRVVMARDGMNADHPDSAAAVTKALAGLDQAIDATCWMETLATVNGTYPELKD